MHKKAMEMAEWALCKAKECGYENIDSQTWDDMKDCMEAAEKAVKADYYYHIVEAMKKADEEDEAEEKYILKMLKEEYGDEEGERRYYDHYRYKNGRFAPKGKGTYRRGYEEPPYYHMTPEMYRQHDPEYYRDMDREDGRMYYTDKGTMPRPGGMERANSTSAGRRHYGGDDGRDSREGRSGMMRRSYIESKEMHNGNSPEEKQHKLKELEKYMSELGTDISEMISGSSAEEKTLLKTKLQTLVQKIS